MCRNCIFLKSKDKNGYRCQVFEGLMGKDTSCAPSLVAVISEF
jgi:hypothetical protein